MKYLAILFTLITLQLHAEKKSVELFHIKRNLNSNIVVYAANINTDGSIVSNEPMQAYWIMNAEKGQREGLNFMERRMAYGFKWERTQDTGTYKITLTADKKRVFLLKQNTPFKPQIYTLINGKMQQLKTMKIEADNSGFMPKVKYIELEGIDNKGVVNIERYIPDKI